MRSTSRLKEVCKEYRLGTSRNARRVLGAAQRSSFEVARGSSIGVIGRNGAGKTTLLKLLAGITAPTRGRIVIEGRVAALIEVGSGFHPELTGRENVFLSGAILGMRRREIAAKLDRIVDFAGVERFIDTPVKWYSSGMYVRLGFAVAAHLEPDVLLVDEVLAVGDAEFQVKCLERIQQLQAQGTTNLFISHDLVRGGAAVRSGGSAGRRRARRVRVGPRRRRRLRSPADFRRWRPVRTGHRDRERRRVDESHGARLQTTRKVCRFALEALVVSYAL